MGLLDSYLPLTDIDLVYSNQTVNVADVAANCVWSPSAEELRAAIETSPYVQGVYSVDREISITSNWSVDIRPTDGVSVGLLKSGIIASVKEAAAAGGTGCFNPSIGSVTIKQENGKLPGTGATVAVSLAAIAVIAVAIIIIRR